MNDMLVLGCREKRRNAREESTVTKSLPKKLDSRIILQYAVVIGRLYERVRGLALRNIR